MEDEDAVVIPRFNDEEEEVAVAQGDGVMVLRWVLLWGWVELEEEAAGYGA